MSVICELNKHDAEKVYNEAVAITWQQKSRRKGWRAGALLITA